MHRGHRRRLSLSVAFVHQRVSGHPLATRVDGSLYYVHSDHLGSTVAVSDAAGGEVGRVQYDPYGEVITSTLPAHLTDRLFTGQRRDGTIGLYQMGARWYDPALGRWIQADSIVPDYDNPQALNRYSYVLGNPLRYTDPSGFFGEEEIMGIFGVSTWEEVLAFFKPSGPLAGQWGYLRVLREAEFGDRLDIYAGEQGMVLQGAFVSDSELGYAFAPEGTTELIDLITLGSVPVTDFVLHSSKGTANWYVASQMYKVMKFDPSKVDWTAFWYDLIGCVGDTAILAAPFGPVGEGVALFGGAVSEFTDILSVRHAYRKLRLENDISGWDDLRIEFIGQMLVTAEGQWLARQTAAGIPVAGAAVDFINLTENVKQGITYTP
jgi:RHS repeat-associated protein